MLNLSSRNLTVQSKEVRYWTFKLRREYINSCLLAATSYYVSRSRKFEVRNVEHEPWHDKICLRVFRAGQTKTFQSQKIERGLKLSQYD